MSTCPHVNIEHEYVRVAYLDYPALNVAASLVVEDHGDCIQWPCKKAVISIFVLKI